MTVIAMWAHPRALSTAFFRMMAERGDLRVFHEPFTDLAARGFVEVDGVRLDTPAALAATILRSAPVFWKDTTEYRHASLLDLPGMKDKVKHVFLVRDPRAAIASHHAVNPKVTCDEIGYERQFEVFSRVVAAGREPIVLDAAGLVADPVPVVRGFCARAGIPFRADALNWDRGMHPAWSRTQVWHTDASDSTGFAVRPKTYDVTVDNDERLAGYYRYHLPFYERMREVAVTSGWSREAGR